ncbi:phosphogluconate dehydratase [Simiduia litorea]|uniref:phosphogluconate dehydratase n=1 Tax=Simiduia litorea TaxID=1435348 RepID=UPI0036F28EFA
MTSEATTKLNPVVAKVTATIIERSRATRTDYLARMEAQAEQGPHRKTLPCGNLAHGFAACGTTDKELLAQSDVANIAIVSSYNDMLSAHQPFEDTPKAIKKVIAAKGSVAQFAGGVPAMCDGITQGMPGMELSLFSRDVIAMSTAIALSHNMFDGALCLGVCDKIIPGMLIGALSFGHLPMIFIPAGPMPSGLPNDEKARVRQLFAQGKVGREELLAAESASYHSAGTCTFYGTANSNQLLMEIMGLHLPGSSFINPNTPLREALTAAASEQVLNLVKSGSDYRPLAKIVDEKAIVNAVVGLVATGGSTNHTMHLVAMAAAAGIVLTWDDFSALSAVIPSLTKIYPNGVADINHFQAAGGMSFLIATLLDAGLLHADVLTVHSEPGLQAYRTEPQLREGKLAWADGPTESLDTSVLRAATDPFSADGGLKVLKGNLGRGVIKTSAVKEEYRVQEAPAIIFQSQAEFISAFQQGLLEKDFIAVLRYQGPRANGMPELHKLVPILGSLQDKGFKVGLVTDGRMSGASGKVAAAIHVTPEAAAGGVIGKIQSGDVVRLDATTGELNVLVDQAVLDARIVAMPDLSANQTGCGRELFAALRNQVTGAATGARSFDLTVNEDL